MAGGAVVAWRKGLLIVKWEGGKTPSAQLSAMITNPNASKGARHPLCVWVCSLGCAGGLRTVQASEQRAQRGGWFELETSNRLEPRSPLPTAQSRNVLNCCEA